MLAGISDADGPLVMELARQAGLHGLADARITVPPDKGTNAGSKVAALVAGGGSVDDMAVLRHGGMKRIFSSAYAPSVPGSFLCSFTFGHVRQLDAVAFRFISNFADRAPLLGTNGAGGLVFVDVDDTVVETFSPRSHPERRTNRSPVGWWCAGSRN
jgi:hypothetical protein